MAFSTAQLQALQNALASGELEVTFQGRRTVYRSIDDLTKAISIVQAGLNADAGITKLRTVKTFMSDEDDCTI